MDDRTYDKEPIIRSLIMLICIIVFIVVFMRRCERDLRQSILIPEDNLMYGEVTRVIDGDTFILTSGGQEFTMRLIGVDAPESVHPDESKNTEEGTLASSYTKEALEGKTVGIEFDTQTQDKYGRYLVYVWIDGDLYNMRILEDGHAVLMTIPPNVKYVDALTGN